MKTNFKNIYLTVMISTIAIACKQNDGIIQKDIAGVYFNRAQMENNPDSTTLSFATKPITKTQDTVWVSIGISGKASNTDRIIPISIDQNLTNAKLGEDFDIKDAIVKARQYTAKVPILLYKTDKLTEQELRIYLTLNTSSDFPLKITKNQTASTLTGTNGANYNNKGYLIKLNNQLKKPDTWYMNGSWFYLFFGEFSMVKWKFILEVTQRVEWGQGAREGAGAPNYEQMNTYLAMLLYAIDQYEQANGPLIDENGNKVAF